MPAKKSSVHIPICGNIRCPAKRTITSYLSVDLLCGNCLKLLREVETLLAAVAEADAPEKEREAIANVRAWFNKYPRSTAGD